jgi:DNA processing protein
MANSVRPDEWWASKSARGIRVTWPGEGSYPAALLGDPQPPGVLFWRGSIEWLDGPCVAVVGTRNATPDGRATAFELGRDLARAGICVVSGLALGIDGAAHVGALEAAATAAPTTLSPSPVGTVGVAASGVDVPYPRRHTRLWERVVVGGAVIGETPPGQPALPWRFPSRNRIIAGLCRLVVVVESHARGGSLITADAAIERGVDVKVVPGPVHSPACEGTNQLLYDGPGPVRDARDVLDCLGMLVPGGPSRPARDRRRSSLPLASGVVLEAVGWRPSTLGQIVARSAKQAAEVVLVLDDLAARGLVREEGGWWSRIK